MATTTEQRTLRIGLLGRGTVGSAFERLLDERGEQIETRHGVRPRITRVLSRDDPDSFLRGSYDVVVEAIGGTEAARRYVRHFLSRGTPVVTANKALLAEHGTELRSFGTALRGEAAVGAAIPLLGVLDRSLQGATIRRVTAILNGTSNYVLTRMRRDGLRLGEAVERAQQLGFAEADPTLDIAGTDAAHKLAILLGHDGAIETTSLAGVRACDCEIDGYILKPVAYAGSGAFVAPAYLPVNHSLAAVHDEENGIVLETDRAGPITLRGAGAGGDATALALLDDVLTTHTPPRRSIELDAGPCATDWFVNLELHTNAPILDVARATRIPIRSWSETDTGFRLRTGALTRQEIESFLTTLRPLRALTRTSAYRILEN